MIERGLLTAALALAPALAATASVWDVFADRCLAPMSEVEPPRVAGLSRGGDALAAEHFDAEMLAPMQSYAISGASTLVVRTGDDAGPPTCLVITDDDAAETERAAADAWLADATANGDWAFAADGFLGPEYLSTTWREPKLRFTLIDDPRSARLIFALSETELES